MKLFTAFSRKAPNRLFLAIVLGSMAGVAYSLLIPIVLEVLSEDNQFVTEENLVTTYLGIEVLNAKFASLFLWVTLFILVSRTVAQILLTRLSIDVTSDLRKSFYQRIARSPLVNLEAVDSPRLMATITHDVNDIMVGAKLLPDLIIAMVTVISMLGFLLFLNSEVFWFVLGAIAFGIITYQVPMFIGNRFFITSRERVDELYEGIRALIYGAKELKLNARRRAHFTDDELLKSEHAMISAEKAGLAIVRTAINYGDMISFFVIGVVTFVFVNYSAVSQQELIGVIMALLYLGGPVGGILNMFPEIAMAKVSLRKVKSLLEDLPEESVNDNLITIPDFQTIKFQDIEFEYPRSGEDKSFHLGPISFSVKKGQTTFIVGGNGSGKSTLSKILTLHYRPLSGAIKFDEQAVDEHNIVSYRERISAIYTDYYLFKTIKGLNQKNFSDNDEKVVHYLQKLKLEEKVNLKDGRFSTLALSDGQRKRLALLISFLEDKDFYLFDEWAADQDPDFKRFFYYELLPELRDAGKAVVVISHDDRYFDLADQVIVMESGKLLEHNPFSLAVDRQLQSSLQDRKNRAKEANSGNENAEGKEVQC